jgi:hypothetical protein
MRDMGKGVAACGISSSSVILEGGVSGGVRIYTDLEIGYTLCEPNVVKSPP